jgi:MFS transporter, PPP family, 3-phenylpropionic acid transporter
MLTSTLPLKQILIRFRLAIYFYWALSAAFLGYYVLYFEDLNMISISQIGIMMSLYTFSALVGQNVFGYISDKMRSVRWPVIMGTFLLGLILLFLPFLKNIVWIYASIAFIGFLQQPIGPMLDSWCLKHLSHHDAEHVYGKIRAFGSFGWATSGLITAWFIAKLGWNMMYFLASINAVILIIVTFRVPDILVDSEQDKRSAEYLTPIKVYKKLFSNTDYLHILLVIFLLFLGAQTAYNYLGLIVKDTGGTVINLGLTYLVDAGSEIPAMLLSVWLLRKYPPRRMMIWAVLVYLLRYGLILYFRSPQVVILSSVIHGLAFGLMLTSLRKYIFDIAPKNLQTSALTISDGVLLSLTIIIGGTVGGYIIQHYSVMTLMGFCMGSSFLALLLLIFRRKTTNGPSK